MPVSLAHGWYSRSGGVTNGMPLMKAEPCVGFGKNPPLCRSALRRQQGVTLVEVLVTVVVLSIGLLGVAMLQLNSLNANHSAYMRSQAVNLAYDITDRMRANRQAALQGEYDHALGATTPTGTAVAQQDLSAWLTELAALLPGATGGIERINDQVTVVVRWQDTRTGAEACEEPEPPEEGEEPEEDECVDDFVVFRVVTRL